ncbi:MAG: hypothetical protein J6X91_03290 [Bacteroidales bacterium]|nr:hypothetical protein [Bacteroidales bacterium]
MARKKFLLLQSNPMFLNTLDDISQYDNVVIYHKKRVSKNRLVNLLFNIHNSGKIQKYVELPFKGIWDRLLFNKLLKTFSPDYIVFTVSWYSDHLLKYFRNNCANSKIIFRFTDKIANGLGKNYIPKIKSIGEEYDGVLVYSQEDAERFGFTYHSVGYSVVDKDRLMPTKCYDVVFVGAEKGRIDKIREAYQKFTSAGLSCFFYVTRVKGDDRKDDGIIYADHGMSFMEYLSYVYSAKCLFELVQYGSTGRTFRMMEAIMYNKLLITNCPEISESGYYDPRYVQLFEDVSEIEARFVTDAPEVVDYHYRGDFSPKKVLEFIELTWK